VTPAIADVSIQRATNVDLITAELTKKKRSNRQRDHQHHTFGRVLNESTLREREAFCQFQEVWKELSRIWPNLLAVLFDSFEKNSNSWVDTPFRQFRRDRCITLGWD
jgi:hypothetical protein